MKLAFWRTLHCRIEPADATVRINDHEKLGDCSIWHYITWTLQVSQVQTSTNDNRMTYGAMRLFQLSPSFHDNDYYTTIRWPIAQSSVPSTWAIVMNINLAYSIAKPPATMRCILYTLSKKNNRPTLDDIWQR